MADERIFYCPRHGRVTEAQYQARCCIGVPSGYPYFHFDVLMCDHCYQWYYGFRKYKAKRGGES